jgi:hypothetical protein
MILRKGRMDCEPFTEHRDWYHRCSLRIYRHREHPQSLRIGVQLGVKLLFSFLKQGSFC